MAVLSWKYVNMLNEYYLNKTCIIPPNVDALCYTYSIELWLLVAYLRHQAVALSNALVHFIQIFSIFRSISQDSIRTNMVYTIHDWLDRMDTIEKMMDSLLTGDYIQHRNILKVLYACSAYYYYHRTFTINYMYSIAYSLLRQLSDEYYTTGCPEML